MTGRDLLDRRVIAVLGKGGVGKSVIAAALGIKATAEGKRGIIAEFDGAESISTLFDSPSVGYKGAQVSPGLMAMSITPPQAVEEYLVRMLKFRLLYEVVFRNRYIEPFMNGVMGLSDLISVGKVMDLEWLRTDGSLGPEAHGAHAYDHIILDCPSTGHGLSLLSAPQAMMDITRVGPLYGNAKMIRDLLADRDRVSVILVTLPEEMPINETIELHARLRDNVNIDIAGVVINGVPPKLFASEEAAGCWVELQNLVGELGPTAEQAIRDGQRAQRDRSAAEDQIARLRAAIDLPFAEVPLLPGQGIDRSALASVAEHLRWLP
jgi:anion-transporting  ArsA/GET3 family ATPase